MNSTLEDKERTYRLWALYVMRDILKAMKTQQVGRSISYTKSGKKKINISTGDLRKTMRYKLYNASGGNMEKIEFFFNYYATFVDLGAGREYTYESQRSAGAYDKKYNYKRKYAEQDPDKRDTKPPKPFMLPIFNQEVYILSNIITDKYQEFIRFYLFEDYAADINI